MSPTIAPVQTSARHPDATTVVIIGGGIIGLTAALTLAERNIPVVVLEKGRIAGEQSSRNLGWVRKTNRHAHDIPWRWRPTGYGPKCRHGWAATSAIARPASCSSAATTRRWACMKAG